MRGQSTPAWVVAFGEGCAEPLVVAILSVLVVSFANALSSLSNASSEMFLEYMGLVIVITLITNFVKGIAFPGVAFASVVGMVLGLLFFGSAILSLAPNAVYEIGAYIVAAMAGIYLGISRHR